MVRALASISVAWVRFPDPVSYVVEFVIGFLLAPRGFSPGTPVFTSSQKPTCSNSNSIRNSRATGLSVARLLGVTLIKQSCFIYLFYLFIYCLQKQPEPNWEPSERQKRVFCNVNFSLTLKHQSTI